MKKIIIVLAIVLTSGIAALSINKKPEANITEKASKVQFSNNKGYDSNFKSDISTAD